MRMKQRAVSHIGVIGAGMAGLVASMQLARLGHSVQLIERAKYPGGTAGYYVREGVEYPTGATISFGMEPGGPLRALLEDVGVHLPSLAMEHSMDVVLMDRVVHVYSDRVRWMEELRRAFPERAVEVVEFWKRLERTARAVYLVSKSYASLPIRTATDLGRLPSTVLHHPRLFLSSVPEMRSTVEAMLQKYRLKDYDPFCRFLNAQLLDAAQVDISHAAWLPSAVALDIYRYGTHVVAGGFTAIAQALLQQARALGVQVWMSHTVVGADYDSAAKKWRLLSNRRMQLEVDAVINATGRAIPTSHADHAAANHFDSAVEALEARSVGPRWGAVRLDVLVSSQWLRSLDLPVDASIYPFAFQLANDEEMGTLLEDPDGAVYVTLHPRKECQRAALERREPVSPCQPEDGQVVTVSVHTPALGWISLDKDTYQLKKAAVARALMHRLEKVLPGFVANARVRRMGTPLTYQRYLNKAEVGGHPLTVKASLVTPRGARTERPQWYLAGDTVFPGPGTLSAAMSGLYAARAIDGRAGRTIPVL